MVDTANNVSVGVQQLLEKLHNQGVHSGRVEGEKIVAEARAEASLIMEKAKDEAESIIKQAQQEAKFIENIGKEALAMAARDAQLALKSFLLMQFTDRINKAVSLQLKDEKLLEKIIIEIAGSSGISKDNLEVILPSAILGVEDLREIPENFAKSKLLSLVTEHASAMFKEGVTFTVNTDKNNGITFREKDKNIQVTLDDATIGEMLLKHLQPRFKVLLEGILS